MPRILIADDEPIARELLRVTLTEVSDEFEIVAECSNGRQAVDDTLRLQPDVVFLDVRMPILDGLQAGRVIKVQVPSSIIVYVSAYEEFAYAQQAIEIGTAAYLLKPVHNDAVRSLLPKLVRQSMEGKSSPHISIPSETPLPIQLSHRDPLWKVVEYVDTHVEEDLSLTILAQRAGFHPAALSRAFKRTFGLGVAEYITHKRIERAKAFLLQFPSMSIQQVANQCGFASAQYFNTVFQSFTTCTPKEFRAKSVKKCD